jgi:hypothetical protein
MRQQKAKGRIVKPPPTVRRNKAPPPNEAAVCEIELDDQQGYTMGTQAASPTSIHRDTINISLRPTQNQFSQIEDMQQKLWLANSHGKDATLPTGKLICVRVPGLDGLYVCACVFAKECSCIKTCAFLISFHQENRLIDLCEANCGSPCQPKAKAMASPVLV